MSRQLALVNSHSRYLHRGIVELAERLLATMPAGLDTCLFTTSGPRPMTRLAAGLRVHRREHRDHRRTRLPRVDRMDGRSESQRMARRLPSAAHRDLAAPRPGRESADRTTALERVATSAGRLTEDGDRPALLLADLGFTSEGILDNPADFAAGLLEGAHRAGALFLADEVQAGFGRVGPAFWRFAEAGVTPDIVTLGKPMGAGYPIGAVITRREIADSWRAIMSISPPSPRHGRPPRPGWPCWTSCGTTTSGTCAAHRRSAALRAAGSGQWGLEARRCPWNRADRRGRHPRRCP